MMTIAPQTPEGSGSKGFFNEATAKLTAALQWARAMASRGFTAVIGRLKSAFAWLKSALAKPISIGTVVAPFVLATKTGYNTAVSVIGKVGGWFSRAISWAARKVHKVINTALGWASEATGGGGFFAKVKELYNTGASYVARGWSGINDFGSALLYSAKNNSFVGTVTRGVALAVGCGAALLTAGVAIPFIAPFVLGFGGIATIAATGTLASVAGTVELVQGTSEETQNETVPVQEKATESPKPEAKKPVPAPKSEAKKETVVGSLEDLNAALTFIKVTQGDFVKDKDGQPSLIVPVQILVDLDAMVSAKHAEADAVIKSTAESISEAAEAIVSHKPTPGRIGQPRAERVIDGVTYTRGVNADGSKFEETRAQFDMRLARIEADAASQASA